MYASCALKCARDGPYTSVCSTFVQQQQDYTQILLPHS